MVLAYLCRHPRAKVPADFGRAAILSGNTVPIGLRSIVVIDFAVIFARPIPPLALSVLWRSIEFISREIHAIAAQTRVVVQRRPWHGVKIFTHTQEPATLSLPIRDVVSLWSIEPVVVAILTSLFYLLALDHSSLGQTHLPEFCSHSFREFAYST
jgi:hypothetical protein